MTKYNQLLKENGFLTPQGEQLVKERFLPVVNHFLDMAGSENELRIIGGVLSNIVGKEVINNIVDKSNKENKSGKTSYNAEATRLTDLFDNSMPVGKGIVAQLEKMLQDKTDELLAMTEKYMPFETASEGVLDDLLNIEPKKGDK